MTIRRVGVVVIFAGGIHAALVAQPTPVDGRRMSAEGPRTDHPLALYDPWVGRVVLVGGAGDRQDGNRDAMWSWSGTRWDRLTDAGPPGRVNAGAAYSGRLGKAVVAGGSRKSADGATWQVVGDSWEGDRHAWRRMGDIAPRDHHSLVEDGRDGVLIYGGIPADRSSPWPTDTWALQGRTWTRLATEGPPGRGRASLVYDSRRRHVVLFGGVSAPAAPNQAQTFLGDTWIWADHGWRKSG